MPPITFPVVVYWWIVHLTLRDGVEATKLAPGIVGSGGPGDGASLLIPLRFQCRDLALE